MKPENKYSHRMFIAAAVTIWVLLFFVIIFGAFAIYYKEYSEFVIKEGAKNTVTALEMVVACQQLSNVTGEQIKEQYIKTFILNQTK